MKSKSSSYLQQIEAIIEAHLSEDNFDVERLSELLHLHRSQVFRKVKEITGKDPSQLILEARLRKAKQLLLQTEKNIGEVAYEVGFADPAHFTKTFKRVTGITPSEFRETENSD